MDRRQKGSFGWRNTHVVVGGGHLVGRGLVLDRSGPGGVMPELDDLAVKIGDGTQNALSELAKGPVEQESVCAADKDRQ